jgi:hypothetical protein
MKRITATTGLSKRTIVDIISILLVVLFVYAAYNKLTDYETFKVQLLQSPLLTAYAPLVAWTIPTGEMLIALSLLLGLSLSKFRAMGLYSSLFIMTLFTSYIYIILHYSFYVPCSCGGILSHMSWNQHLLFNFLFIAFSLSGILLQDPGKRAINHLIE